MSIPIFQLILSHLPPLITVKFVFLHLWLYFCFVNKFICAICFKCGYCCFTILYQFLLYNKVNQLYVYIFPLSWIRLPSTPHLTHLGKWYNMMFIFLCLIYFTQYNNLSFFLCLSNVPLSETAMAPHSSTLAWKIPRLEESGGLQSMASLRVRHDWATSLSLFTFMHWRRKWQPTPVFLPGHCIYVPHL